MPRNDVVIKQAEPVRLAEAVGTAPGYGSDKLGPLCAHLLPEVLEHLTRVAAKPGISVGRYEDPQDDGSVVLHAGFDIGDQDVPTSQRVQVVQLPAVQVASSRELYHEFHHEDPTRHVTELQIPVNS